MLVAAHRYFRKRRDSYVSDRTYVADIGLLLFLFSGVIGHEQILMILGAALVVAGSVPPIARRLLRWQVCGGVALLVVALCAGNAEAQTPSPTPAYAAGVGAWPCADWLKKAADKPVRQGAERWLEGFISSVNFEAASAWGHGVPADKMLDNVDSYCRQHPQERFVDAAADMMNRLIHPS